MSCKKTATSIINVYRSVVSPVIHSINISVFGFSSVCRQKPSCSQYTINKIQENGTIRGLYDGIKRVISCHSGT